MSRLSVIYKSETDSEVKPFGCLRIPHSLSGELLFCTVTHVNEMGRNLAIILPLTS